jgi:phosphoserine aminotransferase
MSRQIYNFSAGPAVLPKEVLKKAQSELLDWHGSGMSVMEMSHRGKEFMSIAEDAETDFRDLLCIPSNYKVLFLQGGATLQFSMVPMNCLRGKTEADYVNTGIWSKKAINEAKRYCKVNVVAELIEENGIFRIPREDSWKTNPDAAYLHYTANETIGGVAFDYVPSVGSVPVIADMSSSILSQPIDVSAFGLIYAGAQKNIGPAGLTLVIVREDLMGTMLDFAPSLFDYKEQAKAQSAMNTPPTYGVYVAGLVFKWLKKQGGLVEIAKQNEQKASKLYKFIDDNDFYSNPVDKQSRSLMNVAFKLSKPELDQTFLNEAKQNGLLNLKGHRSVGGMRASIYNAMPQEGVDALIDFMESFAKQHS